MDKADLQRIIDQFAEALDRHGVHVLHVVLFGSQAAGTATEWSDIDLAVISRDFEGKNILERLELLAKAIADVWQPIEAIGFTPEEWELGESAMAQIAREGTAVYRAGGPAPANE